MLAGQTVMQITAPALPGLRLVVRDRPHATRRLTSRGWKADPFLNEVQAHFIFGHKSPARLIENSEVYAAWFAKAITQIHPQLRAVRPHPACRDMHFAPHRFDSTQKPLAKVCFFLPAVLTTMIHIIRERSGEDRHAARTFLDWLDMEKCLQLAMMADGGEEQLELIRLMDYQGFPLDELAYNLSAFRSRLHNLFVSPEAGELPTCVRVGFTAHMLKILSHPMGVPTGAGGVRYIGANGGVPLETQLRCVSRMSNWTVLVEHTLQAEFPACETIQAWGVFNVVHNGGTKRIASGVSHDCLTFKQFLGAANY